MEDPGAGTVKWIHSWAVQGNGHGHKVSAPHRVVCDAFFSSIINKHGHVRLVTHSSLIFPPVGYSCAGTATKGRSRKSSVPCGIAVVATSPRPRPGSEVTRRLLWHTTTSSAAHRSRSSSATHLLAPAKTAVAVEAGPAAVAAAMRGWLPASCRGANAGWTAGLFQRGGQYEGRKVDKGAGRRHTVHRVQAVGCR